MKKYEIIYQDEPENEEYENIVKMVFDKCLKKNV